MKYFQIIILALFLNFYGSGYADETPDDLSIREVSLPSESEPLAVVGGCVNVINGSYFQIETDLVSNNIEPLMLNRYYDSENKLETSLGLGFGLQFPILATEMQKNARHAYAMISEREGSFLA